MSDTDANNGGKMGGGKPPAGPNSSGGWDGMDADHPIVGMTEGLDKFTQAFSASARRWELIVYPSLFAFIILASYGFYLIYKLTTDADRITNQMDSMVHSMVVVSEHMVQVANNLSTITGSMNTVAMEVSNQARSIDSMNVIVDRMNGSVAAISGTVFQLRQDMGVMTNQMHNVARPMNFMNSIMPW
jgi:hypothetical protein